MRQRWQVLGLAVLLLLPIVVLGVGLLIVLVPKVTDPDSTVPRGPLVGGIVIALGITAFPSLPLWRTVRRWRRPPLPAADMGPQPVVFNQAPGRPQGATVQAGPVGSMHLVVDQWEPGTLIRLRQKDPWSGRAVMLLTLALTALFIAIPSFERGALVPGLPEDTATRWIGLWVLAVLAWLVPAHRPRTVSMDWARDAMDLGYGRTRRTLGLSRVRGIALATERSTGGLETSDAHVRPTQITHSVVAWVQPDGGQPVPFLLVDVDSSADERGLAALLHPLVTALAASLNVPPHRPEGAAEVRPYV